MLIFFQVSPRPVEVWQDSHEWELLPTILPQYLSPAYNRAGGLWSSDLSIVAKVVCLHYSHNTWFHKKHHSMPSFLSLTLSWEAKHWTNTDTKPSLYRTHAGQVQAFAHIACPSGLEFLCPKRAAVLESTPQVRAVWEHYAAFYQMHQRNLPLPSRIRCCARAEPSTDLTVPVCQPRTPWFPWNYMMGIFLVLYMWGVHEGNNRVLIETDFSLSKKAEILGWGV